MTQPPTITPYPELARVHGGYARRVEVALGLGDLPVVVMRDGTDLVVRADYPAEGTHLQTLRGQVAARVACGLRPVRDTGRLLRRALEVLVRIQHGGGDLLTGPACPMCGVSADDGHAEDCEVGDVLADLHAEVVG